MLLEALAPVDGDIDHPVVPHGHRAGPMVIFERQHSHRSLPMCIIVGFLGTAGVVSTPRAGVDVTRLLSTDE